jgi:hypothetical protein
MPLLQFFVSPFWVADYAGGRLWFVTVGFILDLLLGAGVIHFIERTASVSGQTCVTVLHISRRRQLERNDTERERV